MADKAHKKTDKKISEMEKRLTAIYSEAEKDIAEKMEKYFAQFQKADDEKRKLVELGELTEAEYKEWRQGKIMYGTRFTALKKNISEELLHVNETATAYINGELPEVYALNYNALEGTVNGVGGYSFTLVDKDTVKHLATTDSSLLPTRKLDPAKDIAWNMKKINSQVLQGIIQGESIPKISKRIMNVQQMNKEAAVRSARTIVTGAECKGRMDSYKRAQDDGIILEREWIATKDRRTRDWHGELDGVEKPIDEPFENAFGEIMYPGDPSAHGANVYNCRCTIAAVVKGFGDKRIDFGGESNYQTWSEWKEEQNKTGNAKKSTQTRGKNAEKSFYKKENSGIISAGAKGALTSKNDPDFSKRDAHAKQYYSSIRNSDQHSIVKAISGNVNIDEQKVNEAVNHIFYTKHQLEKGLTYFDEDYDMAQSIQRLRTGHDIQPHDLILLQHEALESQYMYSGMAYDEAHKKAETEYNYRAALMKFLKDNNLE